MSIADDSAPALLPTFKRLDVATPAQLPDLPTLARDVDAAVQAVRQVATPTTTWKTYASALRYFGAWSQLRLGQPLSFPVTAATVQLFVLDHFGRPERRLTSGGHEKLVLHPHLPEAIDAALVAGGYKTALGLHRMTTIDLRLNALAWAHRETKTENPCQDPSVRQLLADCRKLAKELGAGPRSKTAATGNALEAMLATCDASLEGLRDRALLLFGWTSGGRRRSEIAKAEVEDLEWMGPEEAVFRMRRSKTGDGGPKPVKAEAALALNAWLTAAKISEGPMFRRLWGPRVGGALSGHSIAAIVKRRAALAGLSGDFAGHSIRRGFVTEAGLNDLPLAQTMALTGHRLTKSVVRYSDVGDVLRSKASNLRSLSRAARGRLHSSPPIGQDGSPPASPTPPPRLAENR